MPRHGGSMTPGEWMDQIERTAALIAGPHAYVHAAADYTNTCQQCGQPRGDSLHAESEAPDA